MATLEKIEARMKKLQLQAQALIAKRTEGVIRQVHKLLIDHGLTIADLVTSSTPRNRLAVKKSSVARNSGKTPKPAK